MTLLVRHPATPPGAVQAIDAELRRVPGGAIASFRVTGDMKKLVIPPPAAPERSDGLWRTTCFELFVAREGEGYDEYNLSPSGAWAAYRFDAYRAGMTQRAATVHMETTLSNKGLQVIAKISSEVPEPAHIGLTAVIEEADGAIRYWASAFAPGKPDFHAAAVRCLLLDGVGTE